MFLIYLLYGGLPFIGWFTLFYTGEMVLSWVAIVPRNPEWAVPLIYILMLPAASFAFRKAKKSVEKQMRFP